MRLVGILILLASVVAVGTLLLSPADGTPPAQGEPRNAAAVARNPRTTAYQKSINKGTEWLRSMIRIDGAVGTDRGMPPDLGCTAITGLVLLSQGNTPRSGPDRKKLERVLDWVLGTIERLPEGPDPDRPYTQIQRKIGRNADLFLTALFLSQVLGESIDAESEVRHSLQKVVKIVCLAQKEDGTWGEQSWAPILGTVT